ncbi:MAG: cell envelope integrity protein TolA, partial [Mariniphaga sp.]
MYSRFLQLLLISILLIIAQYSEGQSIRGRGAAVKYTHFQIPGRVRLEKGDPSGAVVNLINLDSKQIEKSITVPSSGKFDLELSYFKEYKMSVSKDGFYDKDINVSTVIPRNIWDQDSIFPPYAIVITLYKKVPGVQLSFEGKTIGKVSYSPNGTLDNFDSNIFIDDQTIQDEIDNAVKNIGDKDFNQKVAQALEYEKKNELSTAYTLYTEASKIKPSDKFVKEKLKELASDLKNLVNQAKLQAEFNRLIAQGDVFIAGINYAGAIQSFKNALKVIPNDPIGVSRLSDAERLLALAAEKAKQDAEKLLALEREKAKAEADKLLALAAEKAKQDAEKQLALEREKAKTEADKLLALAAEKAKAEADKLLALAAEKAKQDAEKQL